MRSRLILAFKVRLRDTFPMIMRTLDKVVMFVFLVLTIAIDDRIALASNQGQAFIVVYVFVAVVAPELVP